MAEVTNWTEYYNALKSKIFQSIEDGSWKTLAVTNIDGVTTTYQSISDLMSLLSEVESKAEAEEEKKNRSPHRPIRTRILRSTR